MSQTLEKLPTVEEMMIALSSPVVPEGEAAVGERAADMQLTTDDMIREIFSMMQSLQTSGGGAPSDNWL